MTINQTNNNAGNVTNYNDAWKEAVAKYKSIILDATLDAEDSWAAMDDCMNEFIVLHGDPTVNQPLGVMNAKSN